MRARDLLGPGGPLAAAIAGYELREGQLRMADAVEDALAHGGVLLAEAGTGTGKTLAYLVPAILSGRKVVISTGTKTLQDQIMTHDLPLLEARLGVPISAACMKGLGNYLCLRRYHELSRSREADAEPIRSQLVALRRFRDTTETGDRGELDALGEDAEIWSHVLSGAETRIGPRCAHHEACFVTAMRRRAEAAQIVVVNHHLFFADLAARVPRGAGVLPDYDAVILDEAHQIEDVATEFFGVRISTARVEALARDAERAFATRENAQFSANLFGVRDAASAFFLALPRPARAEEGRVPFADAGSSPAVRDAMLALDVALEVLGGACKRAGSEEVLFQIARRVTQLRNDLATVCDPSPLASTSRVAWIEAKGRHVAIGANPIDGARILREELLARTPAVVMTSATLSTGGDFSFARARFGIEAEVDTMVVPSPFDYERRAALFVPPDMPDPRDPAFGEKAAEVVAALIAITGGGAFVLSTSHRAMHDLAARVGPRLPDHVRVFVQGTGPKAGLLDRFRAHGDAALFATSSFWEGVDVPGDALRLVIMNKLPFDVPTDPKVAARCARIDAEGKSSFSEYLVPSAVIALKQGFGRLIRNRRDAGVVAVLDPRLITRSYGKTFLASLPPARRVATLAEVRAFYAELFPEKNAAQSPFTAAVAVPRP